MPSIPVSMAMLLICSNCGQSSPISITSIVLVTEAEAEIRSGKEAATEDGGDRSSWDVRSVKLTCR